ncbi:unnamed protein product [Effrenium voratum]|nr:unnamed protein product [Effrenium voratum]
MSSEGTVMIFTLLGLPLLLTILAFFVMGRLSEEKPRPRPTPAPPRSVPPSALPSRPNTSLRPGTSYGAGFPVESAPPTLPVLASLSRNTLPQLPFPQEDSRQSPLTMALFVKNPQGVAVRFDGVLSAAPENRRRSTWCG